MLDTLLTILIPVSFTGTGVIMGYLLGYLKCYYDLNNKDGV